MEESMQQAIVTSGDDNYDEDDVESRSSSTTVEQQPTQPDLLFDQAADDADEAYVSTNLRKPSNSDAVLSCPCCFNTVCMDCQQHERYKHIFRAMFVMGITVSWDRPLEYDDSAQSLVAVVPAEEAGLNTSSKVIPLDDEPTTEQKEIYYTVRCATCETVVAALDMRDEVYHFSGCLASS